MSQPVSGLAASVRNSVESETFDLAGKSASTIEHTTRDAFAEPFTLSETIRITFITGAGKLGRQKYDDGAAKAITSTLRDLGYEEDHSGGAGTFKLQHDTGKNLKTVVVYPKVSGGAEKGVEGMSLESKTESLLLEDSPEYKIAHSSMNVFQRMIESKCSSWSQKKGCVAAIEEIKKTLQELDEKLLHGTPLSDSEQDFYDSVSMSSLEEKQAHVRDLMHKQVDDGDLTAEEKKLLLSQVSERLETMEKEIKTAESEGKKKKVEKLKEMKEKASERKQKLANITPKTPHRLKNEAEIFKLRREMMPLLEIEEGAKGRLLTLKESQAVSRKDEILEEIDELEKTSRGWFESDESFRARVKASQEAWRAVPKKQTKKKPPSKAAPAATAWVTPAARRKTGPKGPTNKNKPARGGGVFAQMMMDDSDSD